MQEKTSNRAASVKPSATTTINAKANKLRADGVDVVNLSIGEPDFDTPEHIKLAAIRAIQEGHTKYTAVDGMPSLKEAIIAKFKRENNLVFTRDQIIVSDGAKQSLYNLTQALLNPGDEVIIPAPYWVSYPSMVKLAEGTPVYISTTVEQRFKINAKQLKAAITPKTRLLFLNSPSNPTGMVYSSKELSELAVVLLENPQIIIATDDIYEHILWTKAPFVNILNVCPELANQTVVVNGVSKSYAMTGWRIGYAAGPKWLISAMNKIQSHSTSNPTSISQYATVEALNGDQSFIHELKRVFKERHDIVQTSLNSMPGVICPPADGAFYLFPCVQKAIEKYNLADDVALCEKILEEAHVAVVPGSEFGTPGFIRISYASSIETLQEALKRLAPVISA